MRTRSVPGDGTPDVNSWLADGVAGRRVPARGRCGTTTRPGSQRNACVSVPGGAEKRATFAGT